MKARAFSSGQSFRFGGEDKVYEFWSLKPVGDKIVITYYDGHDRYTRKIDSLFELNHI